MDKQFILQILTVFLQILAMVLIAFFKKTKILDWFKKPEEKNSERQMRLLKDLKENIPNNESVQVILKIVQNVENELKNMTPPSSSEV